jgi:ABC-2 type transport system ATP-binding protein
MKASQPTARSRPADNNGDAVIDVRNVQKNFAARRGPVHALRGISFRLRKGRITALVGPDGAGKSTLLRLLAGLYRPDSGTAHVLGFDVARQPLQVQASLGYMPQQFGLYADLSVQENLDLYADLQGVPVPQRRQRYAGLMRLTGLAPFLDRLARHLSGGMQQKLGLACTLVRLPELLLLDEPTAGVDPVSRRELWSIIRRVVRDHGGNVLLSTTYLDEAERCDDVLLLDAGQLLDQGPPGEFSDRLRGRVWRGSAPGLAARDLQALLLDQRGVVDAVVDGDRVRMVMDEGSGAAPPLPPGRAEIEWEQTPPRFADAFLTRLQTAKRPRQTAPTPAFDRSPAEHGMRGEEQVIRVDNLQRRFGDFYAVKGLSFAVSRGEIFGLIGGNGAGKSTTFRMLCGILPASGGHLQVLGTNMRKAAARARARIGYMSQHFSLYRDLSVLENLRFFGNAYGLPTQRRRQRIQEALGQFDLESWRHSASGSLPPGYRQRLALAASLLHQPEILFLDEPTSGVDPLARREFWKRINRLATGGVTVMVTTHFMEEAEYCDRLGIMVAGQLRMLGTPSEIKRRAGDADHPLPSFEDAFIRVISGDPER